MYINEYLRGTTVLSTNDSVKITSQTANKYTNPGVKQSFFEEKMKLSTELKNVLEIAEKIDESQPKKENAKYPNWEYYKVRFEINDRQFEAVLNIGVDNKGEKHFYELNKIKEVDDILAQKSPNRSSTSINNSITNLKEDVNTINNNYMLNNSNNTSEYSLSKQNEAGPTKNTNLTYGEDIKLQVEEAIAPLQENSEHAELPNNSNFEKANNTTNDIELYFPNVLFYGIMLWNHKTIFKWLYFPNVLFYGIIIDEKSICRNRLYFPNVLFYGIIDHKDIWLQIQLYFPNVLFYGIIRKRKN